MQACQQTKEQWGKARCRKFTVKDFPVGNFKKVSIKTSRVKISSDAYWTTFIILSTDLEACDRKIVLIENKLMFQISGYLNSFYKRMVHHSIGYKIATRALQSVGPGIEPTQDYMDKY